MPRRAPIANDNPKSTKTRAAKAPKPKAPKGPKIEADRVVNAAISDADVGFNQQTGKCEFGMVFNFGQLGNGAISLTEESADWKFWEFIQQSMRIVGARSLKAMTGLPVRVTLKHDGKNWRVAAFGNFMSDEQFSFEDELKKFAPVPTKDLGTV